MSLKRIATLPVATLLFLCSGALATRSAAEDVTLIAPDASTVVIKRDAFGVPHIFGDSEVGVFFAQGFAAAQDRLYQMETLRRAARGRLSELLGRDMIDFDKNIRMMYYTEAERLAIFQALPPDIQVMIEAYRDGVNTYADSMNANPLKYMPAELRILGFSPWKITDTIALTQFMVRNFGGFGGEELERQVELQTQGETWFESNRPINDPSLPTTIPGQGTTNRRQRIDPGFRVRAEIVADAVRRQQQAEARGRELGLPMKWGSFAVLITPGKSAAGEAMLLGCPQMGEPRENETQITNEVELSCPTLHVGGMIIAGLPGIIIGRNDHHAWSLTSGYTDNIDTYIETTEDTTYSRYWFDGAWQPFETITDTINVLFSSPVIFTHYRTVHGPVFAADLANKQVYSKKMTFWKDEIGMLLSINGMFRAGSFAEFETAAARNPMSFNLFYADAARRVKYWHIGKYPIRPVTVDPRLPANGDGSQEWQGFREFADLPQLADPPQGYLVNWNNKPAWWWENGDNIPYRASADSSNATWRVLAIDRFVKPIDAFTFENLKETPRQINSHGTYQQAVAFAEGASRDENIVPPGQSGFTNLRNESSPHKTDQWPLHVNWQFKDMLFGETITSVPAGLRPPQRFSLAQNYPNPFNPQTTISYSLAQQEHVRLEVFNIRGQRVRTLVDARQSPGEHRVVFDAGGLSSGLYVFKLQAGRFEGMRKAMLLK